MSEKNVLILQCDVVLKNYDMNELYDTILKQKEQGVILLPSYVKVVNVPEEVANGELVVMNSGAPEPQFVIRDSNGSYFKSFGNKLGTPIAWTDSEEKAAKYRSRRVAEDMQVYIKTWYGYDFARVEEL